MKTKPQIRRIVQIATRPDTEDMYGNLYALCDDGTLWSVTTQSGAEWKKLDISPITHEVKTKPTFSKVTVTV